MYHKYSNTHTHIHTKPKIEYAFVPGYFGYRILICIILNLGSKRLSPGDKQAIWMDWVLPIVCTILGRKRSGWEKVYLNNEHRNQLEIVGGTPCKLEDNFTC